MNSEKLEGVLQGILCAMKIVDDDSLAISCQSLKQYRKAILDSLVKVAKTVEEEDNA